METVARREDKARKLIKTGEKKYGEEADLAARVLKHLESGKPARTCPLTDDEKEQIAHLNAERFLREYCGKKIGI